MVGRGGRKVPSKLWATPVQRHPSCQVNPLGSPHCLQETAKRGLLLHPDVPMPGSGTISLPFVSCTEHHRHPPSLFSPTWSVGPLQPCPVLQEKTTLDHYTTATKTCIPCSHRPWLHLRPHRSCPLKCFHPGPFPRLPDCVSSCSHEPPLT